uniref:Uncharacterized protein n=1 Tax=uncultured Alphaproteobacteria bacterium TaxID=91750 RepID=A0A6G8F301_9PROT|nr:hypothetical protein PlAlph_3430 [uncultured Alphaproteobacteria bacterium]
MNNAPHPRCIIRKAFVERLQAANTLAKDHVYDSRIKPLFDQHLPAILVYTRDEKVLENQYDGDGFFPYKRQLDISIEGILANSPDLDELIDKLALDIEYALRCFEITGFLNAVIKMISTETDVVIDGSHCYGAVRINYTITYYTATNKE